MKEINVEGLPEPVARAIETVVMMLRQQLRPPGNHREQVKLLARPGTVIGTLTREEIYEHLG